MFTRKPIDFWIAIPMLILAAIGLMVIISVSNENSVSHTIYLIVGLLFFLITFFLNRTILYSFSNYLYIIGLVGLVLPLIFGTITRGSVRWIDLGFFTVQPSEIIKLIMVLFSAVYWSKKDDFSWKRLIVYLLLVLPIVLLVLIQPDLGSAMVIIAGIAFVVIFSGISSKKIALLCCITALLIPIGWFSIHDYQHQRILNFVNPYRDPLGTGYNAIQARIAVGSGNGFGRGIGKGTQSHLAFLPERYTDFIFASYAEEVGFLGSSLVLLLYFILFIRMIGVVKRIDQVNEKLTIIGLMSMMYFQMIVNVGMNIGIMPIAGVTLPLISYGGSSLIVTLTSLGLICNISSGLRRRSYIRIG